MRSGTRDAADLLRVRLVGSAPGRAGEGLGPSRGKVNYYPANDKSKWITGVDTFEKVRYTSVYPGIDLVYYGTGKQLEYDFVVAPGADPATIQLAVDGANTLTISDSGELVIGMPGGEVRQRPPAIYQQTGAGKQAVSGGYRILAHNRVGFTIGTYDHTRALTIDPLLQIVYGTFLGTDVNDTVSGMAVNTTTRVAYVVGITGVGGTGPYATVWKLAPTGTLASTTVLSQNTNGLGIELDSVGAPYIVGTARGGGNIQLNVAATTWNTGSQGDNAFIAKFNPGDLSVVYATSFGGNSNETGAAITVDSSGRITIAGTYSPIANPACLSSCGLPTFKAAQPNPGALDDAFVTQFLVSGSAPPYTVALGYSTYLGGADLDSAVGVAADGNGNVFVIGSTQSMNFPTRSAAFPMNKGGYDGYLTKLTSAGALSFSTYFGGSLDEIPQGIGLDSAGIAYIAGFTNSVDFITKDAYQSARAGGYDAFVTSFKPTGTLNHSTYIGGAVSTGAQPNDFAHGIAVDPAGNSYVIGDTACSDFPLIGSANPDPLVSGGTFVIKLASDGKTLLGSQLFRSSVSDQLWGIATDNSGGVYVGGAANSPNFFDGLTTPAQPYNGSLSGSLTANDGWAAKLIYPNTMISSSFNGTPIQPNNVIWFNANLTISGATEGSQLYLRSALVKVDGLTNLVHIPNGVITFSKSNTCISTTYNSTTDTWETQSPLSPKYGVFISGAPVVLSSTLLSGSLKPVNWYGEFAGTVSTLKPSWKWSAAVYTQWPAQLLPVSVKAGDDGTACIGNTTTDKAGTPIDQRPYVTAGAKGNGGANYTGSFTGSMTVTPDRY